MIKRYHEIAKIYVEPSVDQLSASQAFENWFSYIEHQMKPGGSRRPGTNQNSRNVSPFKDSSNERVEKSGRGHHTIDSKKIFVKN